MFVFQDVVPDIETPSAPPLPKAKDQSAGAPNKMVTFVDIVGRSSSSGPEKYVNGAEDSIVVDLSSELPSVDIHKHNHADAAHSDDLQSSFPASCPLDDKVLSNKEYKDPLRESSNIWGLGRARVTPTDALTNEQSGLILDSEQQMLRGPCASKDDSLSFNDVRLKEPERVSQIASLDPSSYLTKTPNDSITHSWWRVASPNPNGANVDEASVTFLNSTSDGSNEKKFQCSAKSDKVYRSSNSFSNEEIVEHLRRLDGDKKITGAQNSTLEDIESSILADIMSLNFDVDSSTSHSTVGGSFDRTDRQHNSSWNLYNNDKSELSFVKQGGFVNPLADNTGQQFQKCPSLQDMGKSKEPYSYKPQYLGKHQLYSVLISSPILL